MLYSRVAISAAMMAIASLSPSHAGSCSSDVARIQDRVDRYLEAKAAAGPRAVEGVTALMHRQPTPASIAAAEEKLGELDARTFGPIAEAMSRARAADRAGDASACEQALTEVQLTIGPRICGRLICR
jgi:hypothetical protein